MIGNRLVAALLLFVMAVPALAESDFYEEFERNYATLDLDLLNNAIEMGEIANFTYEKDVATFTFTEGRLILLRYVMDRPTTAVFIGKGSARIRVPSPVEQQSLLRATGDSLVNEDFEICFMRIGDDFDLKVREVVDFEATTLEYKYFTQIKQSQGEFFFKPRIYHKHDNYFQLLRSCYERAEDGYFWIDFNRYIYSFDPNRTEEVLVGYEYEGGDFELTEAVRMQREERGIYKNLEMSQLAYPTTMLNQNATIEMGGLDGKKLEAAEATLDVVLNLDSAKFVNLYLHYNLHEDSVSFNGQPVDYWRRNDFNVLGIILPEYYRKGDTLTFTFWYHGKEFLPALPFVEDPSPVPHTIHFKVPKGYTYLMPDKGGVGSAGRHDTFTVVTQNPYRMFNFQGYAGGYESIDTSAASGTPISVLRSKAIKKSQPCYIPPEDYLSAAVGGYNFMERQLGAPPSVFSLTVFPDSSLTMPGLMELPQIYCYQSGTGGIWWEGGRQASRQWFGALLKPRSDREMWLADAIPDYLGMMYTQEAVSIDAFYTELVDRRNRLEILRSQVGEVPLAIGDRINPSQKLFKGSWLIHMLRFLMYDLESGSERQFRRFLLELSIVTNSKQYTNADIIAVAEKYYGDKLDWFFDHWLFGRVMPKYKVNYRIESGEAGWFVRGQVEMERVEDSYKMPVLIRVAGADGQSRFFREMLEAPEDTFSFGPFDQEPKELFFNEFYSVLADTEVKKN